MYIYLKLHHLIKYWIWEQSIFLASFPGNVGKNSGGGTLFVLICKVDKTVGGTLFVLICRVDKTVGGLTVCPHL